MDHISSIGTLDRILRWGIPFSCLWIHW